MVLSYGGALDWQDSARFTSIFCTQTESGSQGESKSRQRVTKAITFSTAWVDVRTPEEYHGQLWDWWKYQAEASQRGGHIPGAVNIPWDRMLNADGTFKSVEELQTLYTSNGVTSDKEAISYCIVCGRSNHTWFVLTYLLGYPKVRLYDGSWAEWSTLIGVPIEK